MKTYNVDDDILVESCPVICSYVTNLNNSFRVIGIYMENWCINNTANICAIRRRSTITRICGEPDLYTENIKLEYVVEIFKLNYLNHCLIVGHNVNCTTSSIVR